MSRTCDILRAPQLAVAEAVQADQDQPTGQWKRPSRLPLHEYDDGTWVVDLTTLRHVPREDLPLDDAQPGVVTAEEERKIRRHVGRFFSKPSYEEYVENTLKPLTDLAKKRHNKESAEGELCRALTDVRLEFPGADLNPRDRETGRELTIHYIVADDQAVGLIPDPDDPDDAPRPQVAVDTPLPEIAEMWSKAEEEQRGPLLLTYLERLTKLCVPHHPIDRVTMIAEAESEFSFALAKATTPIEVEYLSYADA